MANCCPATLSAVGTTPNSTEPRCCPPSSNRKLAQPAILLLAFGNHEYAHAKFLAHLRWCLGRLPDASVPTFGAVQERYDALRNQHCRSFGDPGPGGLRHRLSTKNVRDVFADDRFRFGGRAGGASRTRAASSGQSGEPNRANRRRIGSGARCHTDADGGGDPSDAPRTAGCPEPGANARGAGVNSDTARRTKRRTERRGSAETRAGRHFHTALRQARRHGFGTHRGNRHDWRSRLRLRAFQAI